MFVCTHVGFRGHYVIALSKHWVSHGWPWVDFINWRTVSIFISTRWRDRHSTRGMSGRRLNDDVDYNDLAPESCTDGVIKKSGKKGWKRERLDNEDEKMGWHQLFFFFLVCIFIKQSSAPPSTFHLHGDLDVCVCVCVCVCVWGERERERERERGKILRERKNECMRAEWSISQKADVVNHCFPSLTELLGCSLQKWLQWIHTLSHTHTLHPPLQFYLITASSTQILKRLSLT